MSVFLHDQRSTSIVNGKKVVNEEYINDVPKAITIKYYGKENEKIKKIVITKIENQFKIKT